MAQYWASRLSYLLDDGFDEEPEAVPNPYPQIGRLPRPGLLAIPKFTPPPPSPSPLPFFYRPVQQASQQLPAQPDRRRRRRLWQDDDEPERRPAARNAPKAAIASNDKSKGASGDAANDVFVEVKLEKPEEGSVEETVVKGTLEEEIEMNAIEVGHESAFVERGNEGGEQPKLEPPQQPKQEQPQEPLVPELLDSHSLTIAISSSSSGSGGGKGSSSRAHSRRRHRDGCLCAADTGLLWTSMLSLLFQSPPSLQPFLPAPQSALRFPEGTDEEEELGLMITREGGGGAYVASKTLAEMIGLDKSAVVTAGRYSSPTSVLTPTASVKSSEPSPVLIPMAIAW